MATVTEAVLEEQLDHLTAVASSRKWCIERIDAVRFSIALPARDGTLFCLLFRCDDLVTQPPAVHWHNPANGLTDQPEDTPTGGGFFHGNGVICAPWNRLAYRQCDARGPHSDWQLSNWMTNPKTGGTTTLTAMVLRVFTELNGPAYAGRRKK